MMTVDEKIKYIKNWFANQNFNNIELQHSVPDNTHNVDYLVEHELGFRPSSLNQLYCVIWITDDGYLSFTLETWNRIAKKLNIETKSIRFGGGFEPCTQNVDEIIDLLELTKEGLFIIEPKIWPIVGLTSVKIFLETELYSQIKNPNVKKWIHSAKQIRSDMLRFEPWS